MTARRTWSIVACIHLRIRKQVVAEATILRSILILPLAPWRSTILPLRIHCGSVVMATRSPTKFWGRRIDLALSFSFTGLCCFLDRLRGAEATLDSLSAVGLVDWLPLAEHLAQTRPVLVFDNRGIGGSRVPPEKEDENYTCEDMAQDVIDLVNHVGWKDIDLLGFSMVRHTLTEKSVKLIGVN